MGAVILVALATGALAQTRRPTPHEALDVATAPVRAALDALRTLDAPSAATLAGASSAIDPITLGRVAQDPAARAELIRDRRTRLAALPSAIASGDVDALVVPMFGDIPAALHLRKLFDERFVGIARRGHPLLRDGTMSLEDWVSVGHVFIAPRGRPGGVVDTALAQQGLKRRVSLAVPQFLVAPHVVTRTDLVGVLGARLAESLAETLPLVLFEPPIPLPGFPTHLVWHARLHEDPAQKWFRRCVRESVQARVAREAR